MVPGFFLFFFLLLLSHTPSVSKTKEWSKSAQQKVWLREEPAGAYGWHKPPLEGRVLPCFHFSHNTEAQLPKVSLFSPHVFVLLSALLSDSLWKSWVGLFSTTETSVCSGYKANIYTLLEILASKVKNLADRMATYLYKLYKFYIPIQIIYSG